MKTSYIYLVLVLLVFLNINVHAQKYSFFDNLEVSAKPLIFAINNWNVHYSNYSSSSFDIYNPLEEWEQSKVEFIDPIKVKNYLTQEYDIKVFFNVFKNFKMGFGTNYKMRKLEYDIYFSPYGNSPRSYTTIWALHYFAKYNYIGYNINFRWNIPKIKSNINFFWELNEPFNKDTNEPELTVLYDYKYYLGVKTRHPVPGSLVFSDYIGLDINTRVYKSLYLNLHMGYKYVADYDSRFGLYDVNDPLKVPEIVFDGYVSSNDLVVGIGLTYAFFK